MDAKLPNLTDLHVSRRMLWRRKELNISQEALAERLGVTFQQIQKYERGANRVGASRLYDLSRVLDVPVSYFFADMPDETAAVMPGRLPGRLSASREPSLDADVLLSKETADLVRAYYAIGDMDVRRRTLDFLRTVSESISLERVPAKEDDPSGEPESGIGETEALSEEV